MRAYIAAPLFSDAERQYNLAVDAALNRLGLETYLPQRDNIEDNLMAGSEPMSGKGRNVIFHRDVNAIKKSDFFIIVLDGRVPDEGSCVELGMAYAWQKICLGLQTDTRSFDASGSTNLMIEFALKNRITRSLKELTDLVSRLLAEINPSDPGFPV
jgi:nucleoside 2-deoxyribosyltransferase